MKRPYLIALIMATALVLWMASGLMQAPAQKEKATPATPSEQRMLVQTEQQTAQAVQLNLTIQGQVEPNRTVTIRSDIAGRIAGVLVGEGEWVPSGTVLVRLEPEDRRIKLEREKALLQSREKAYQRAQTLTKNNFQAKSMFEEAFAALKAAEASVAQMELEIEKLDIKAPFAGIPDTRMVEQGGYIAANGEIARFVDNSPLIVVVPVAQKNVLWVPKIGVN